VTITTHVALLLFRVQQQFYDSQSCQPTIILRLNLRGYLRQSLISNPTAICTRRTHSAPIGPLPIHVLHCSSPSSTVLSVFVIIHAFVGHRSTRTVLWTPSLSLSFSLVAQREADFIRSGNIAPGDKAFIYESSSAAPDVSVMWRKKEELSNGVAKYVNKVFTSRHKRI